jgi:hypothetical protein
MKTEQNIQRIIAAGLLTSSAEDSRDLAERRLGVAGH